MAKKIIALILIGAFTISALSACGSTAQESANTTKQAVETAAETEETETGPTAEELEEPEETVSSTEEADACYEAGRACLYGLDGQDIDYEAAYNNFEQAVEKGKIEANFYLGALYDWFSYPKQDYRKAKSYYEAAGDNPYAKLFLGFLYYNGQGVEADTAKGQELFDSAIADGCVEGYLGKADIARDEEDYAAALEYYNKVLEGQEPLCTSSAMSQIGYMYYNGFGVEQDYAIAMEWYEKAADLGHSNAMSWIGYMYYNGIGVEQDYAAAMEWLVKAADHRDANAMNIIGNMYYKSIGVEQDYAAAMEWFEKAADLGNPTAMNNIGCMYYEGQGVEQDYGKAVEWLEKAANLGISGSMINVAYMYENGLGVEQDLEKAQEWYDKAAEAEKNKN